MTLYFTRSAIILSWDEAIVGTPSSLNSRVNFELESGPEQRPNPTLRIFEKARELGMKTPRWHQVRAILLLPGVVTGLIPLVLLLSTTDIYIGWSLPEAWKSLPILIGLLLIGFGLVLVGQTVRMFATRGHGTLAPWEPPPNLVVVGVYRHVRNPMISGVLSIVLGESLFFGSITLLLWFLGVAG